MKWELEGRVRGMLEFAARLTEMDAAYESLRHTVWCRLWDQTLTNAPPLDDVSDQVALVV